MTQEAALEDAAQRYAMLIGIQTPDDEANRAWLEQDRAKYAHFVHRFDNMPLWVEREATTFVAEEARVSREVAAAWLNIEWQGGGEA